jgi:hypothetical protein
MEFSFTAQYRMFGLSECQLLFCKGSREIENLASRGGWSGVPGQPLSVSLGTILNMMVLSIGRNQGVELQAMAPWLPGLRDEALLKLGENISNWMFDGPYEAERQFWPILYGSREVVRPRIAPLLKCYSHPSTNSLRFFSQSDIERISSCGSDRGASNRTPRFTISAHALADQVQTTFGYPLFTAKVAISS